MACEPASAQTSTPALDQARQQPILEGDGAAGIRLGDSEDAVATALDSPPQRTESVGPGSRRVLVYVSADPSNDWSVTIRVLLGGDAPQVQAIGVLISRRETAANPYSGRTGKGYEPGQPADWAQAVYGFPDRIITGAGDLPDLWWYREAGLVIAPGWRANGDQYETWVAVMDPPRMLTDIAEAVFQR
jgi:hypothetical protein